MTLARAVYQVGDLDRAVELQEQALDVADEGNRKRVRAGLEYYKLCRKLRDDTR